MKSINNKTYFFILGTNPQLSIAEIFSLLPDGGNFKALNNQVLLLETDKEINAPKLIRTLGGTIKIGELNANISFHDTTKLIKASQELFAPGTGKFKFGISFYGQNKLNTKKIGMELKNYLKSKKISCRWVISQEKTLSSVVVTQNKLCDTGIELVYIEDGKNLLVGKTLAVQAFKELSFRDFKRPNRDSQSGMLPPKLAQIMINLAGAKTSDRILDPFCGSGTVLMEALLQGFEKVFGTDISAKAIEDSKANTIWLYEKFPIDDKQKCEIKKQDVTKLSLLFPKDSIDVIVTEPYLGPQRGSHEVKKVKTELEMLYTKAIAEFAKILSPDGKVVMLWPMFTTNRERQITNSKSARTEFTHINPKHPDFKIVSPLPNDLSQNKNNISFRNTLIYGREGQRVWREIVILKKI